MSLVNTLMQPLRANYQGQLDKNEVRPTDPGVFNFFQEENSRINSIFDEDIRGKVKASFNNSVQIPVINANNINIGNVRSCVIGDAENTSQLVTLTFVTYVFSFSMYPAQYGNNDVRYQQDFTRKLNERLVAFSKVLDTACINALETAKNQLWTNIAQYYPQVGNALQITQAQKNDFYNNADAIMGEMDFGNPLHVIGSTSARPLVRRLDNQGSNNGINESFQLAPYSFHNSNRVTNAALVQSTGYLVQEGTVAMESRIDFDAMNGSKVGNQMTWERVMVPIPGSPYSVEMAAFYREDCADGSGIQSPNGGVAGNTRTKRESFEWSVDMVFATAFNSNLATRYNPIVKFQIATT